MSVAWHDSPAADAVFHIWRVGIAVGDEDAVNHGTVGLGGADSVEQDIGVGVFVKVEEVVGEGDDVVGVADGPCVRRYLAREHGAVVEWVALIDYVVVFVVMVESVGVSSEDLDSVGYYEGIVKDVVLKVGHIMLSGAGGRIYVGQREVCRGAYAVAHKAHLHRPRLVGLSRHRLCRGVGIAAGGEQRVLVTSGGIQHELQFLLTGGVERRVGRGVAVKITFVRNIEDCDARVCDGVGFDEVRSVELIRAYVHTAVLHAVGEHHIVGRQCYALDGVAEVFFE